MRILVDCHCFDSDSTEGINTYIRGIYTELIHAMPEVDFYFAAVDTLRIRNIFGEAPNVHYITLRMQRRLSRVLREYPRIVKQYGIDLAHFQYFSPPVIGCKTVITLHDLLFKDFPHKFPLSYRLSRDLVFRFSARRADILATVSKYSRQRIAAHYGIEADKIILTPNGVSGEWFEIPLEAARKYAANLGLRRYILNVSRMEPRKNQLLLLQAYTELKLAQKGYDLVFIGQHTLNVPEFDSYLKALPAEVSQHIHHFKDVGHEQLKLLYRAADLFVYPSLAEGFGIPPIEAAAAGVPVICNSATAMSEFDFLGHNLIDVNPPGALRNAIKRNLSAPPSAEKLSEISRIVKQRYSWKNAAEALRFAFLHFL